MDIETAMTKIAESRQALLLAIQDLNEYDLTQPLVEGEWTIRDLIGHITSWDEVCLHPLREFANGKSFAPENIPDHIVWNDNQAAGKKNKPLARILEECKVVREELLDIANRLTSDQLSEKLSLPWGERGTSAYMLAGLAWHEMEHVKSIQKWRDIV